MIEVALEYSSDGLDGGLQRCQIDSDQIMRVFESAPRPAVFVMKTAALEKLLRSKDVNRRIGSLKRRHPSRGLAQYFKGTKPVALEGNYKTGAKLVKSVRDFLRKAEEGGYGNFYFLGVSAELYDELAREAPEEVRAYADTFDAFDSRIEPEPVLRLADKGEAEVDWLETFQGKSLEAQKVRKLIEVAAHAEEFAERPVLILGPTGAGKEVVAKAIHHLGRGAVGGSLVDVNCAAIAPDMFEAELFGVARDVATGVAPRIGLWELASRNRGTLFLNEVGELTLPHQAKILRALEEDVIRRVGGRENISVSARVIADTNRELFQMARFGEFRQDLAQRLARMVIRVPGLAARRDDIAEHAQDIWREQVTRRPDARLSAEILSILSAHSWPGGVRELRGLLETTYALRYGNLSPEADALYEAWEARGDSPLPGSAG